MSISKSKRGGRYLKKLLFSRIFKVYITYLFCLIVVKSFESISTHSFIFDPLELLIWQNDYYWFVFIILFEYILFLLLFVIVKNKKTAFCILSCLQIALVILLYKTNKPGFWYDTLIAFPFGVFWALYRNKIDTFFTIKQNSLLVLISTAAIIISSFALINTFPMPIYFYVFTRWVLCISFITFILSFCVLFKTANKLLICLSSYSFYSYILQSVSFFLFATTAEVASFNTVLFFISCLTFTIALCFAIKFIIDKIWLFTFNKINTKLSK